jgi:hypothetical protein
VKNASSQDARENRKLQILDEFVGECGWPGPEMFVVMRRQNEGMPSNRYLTVLMTGLATDSRAVNNKGLR